MIIKGGKKVIGVSRGATPITKIYKGTRVVWEKEKADYGNLCDIVLCRNKDNFIFSTSNVEKFSKDDFTPIGIVIIPSHHDVYGTGESGILGLNYLDNENPDNGNNSNKSMYFANDWGYNNYRNRIVSCGTIKSGSFTSLTKTGTSLRYVDDYVLTPMDIKDETYTIKNPYDNKTFYPNNSTSYIMLSPYNNDGSFNEDFSTKQFDTSFDYNLLQFFDGKETSNNIIDQESYQEDWKTADVITDSKVSGHYPLLCCAWRYHTRGTKQGDWFIPSLSEVIYLAVRRNLISKTFERLNKVFDTDYLGYAEFVNWCTSTSYGLKYLSNLRNGLISTKDVSFTYKFGCLPYSRLKIDRYNTPEDIPYPNFNGHSYVDMGDAGYWATCNVGANNPEEDGLVVGWGETSNRDISTWDDYKFGTSDALTKYNEEDGLTTLEPEDDAANVIMGGDWRIPTADDFITLHNLCRATGTIINGVPCIKYILKADEQKSIIIPSSRYVGNAYFGYYWTSSLHTEDTTKAISRIFGYAAIQYYNLAVDRCGGDLVRAFIPKG